MAETLSVGGITVARGEKKSGMVRILDTQTSFPVTLIKGINEGKTVLITGGIHGGEYPCIETAIELAQEIQPHEIAGSIILVHPVNTQGFNARGSDIVPEDGKNINRVFPGDRDGTITDQIAYVLTHEFQDRADFYIDIHGGDLNELMTPLAFFPGAAEREVTEVSLGAAKSLRVEYLVRSGAKTGAYNSAAIRGVPSILIERGGRGLWSREEVEEYKKDVRNVLKHLGVLNGEPELNGKTPVEVTGVVYLRATNAGCWYPCVTANEKVAVGQKLGEVRDFFGKVLDTYYSEINGVVLYMTVSLAVRKRAHLVAYGKLPE